ncbi:hypothetical protein KAX35_07310 [candidate division WOR-3 bacterium]|nr:hypothetical protein [candidate division WOR-3 bacterium]
MFKYVKVSILIIVLFLISGCGPRVMVPPEIDLTEYEVLGLIGFSSNMEGNHDEYATQKFIEAITENQKGIRIIELGSEDEILESLNQKKVNSKAVKVIGEQYNVKTVIIGDLNISDVKPKIDILSLVKSMSFSAEVKASLSVRLLETNSGATIWTNSAQDEAEVANISIISGNLFSFNATDPDEAYGDLIDKLVRDVTKDFRVTYKRM